MREAIILAGGLGTRLRAVIGDDTAKPMAHIAGKPFLHYVFKQLERWNVQRVVLSVGYKHDAIKQKFSNRYFEIDVGYSEETEPLGTGGAIRQSLHLVQGNECFILNGDSFFDASFDELEQVFTSHQADLTMALKHVEKSDRYGTVELDERNRIVGFNEKQYVEAGFVNGGVYFTTKALLNKLPQQQRFSFENDYLKAFAPRDAVYGVKSDGYFIDIGIPEDYERANQDFAATP